MDSVSPRDWRKAKPGTHTKEVTETRQELPVEFQELLLATAEDLASANIKLVDAQMEAAALKARVVALEGLRETVERLEATVGAFGSVTLNDLMRKTA